MALSPGSRIGHYEIVGPLGAGGMGEVYRARDTRLGRDVAVKVLPEALAANPERLARLEREARAVASLNHPNIVVLHSIEESDRLRFLTMELVEGDTLDSRARPGGLALNEILDLALPLAEALAAAHHGGVIHRDLKPGNVMVTSDGRVKVLDFGLAKQIEAGPGVAADSRVATEMLSTVGEVMGTLPYMAPEQLRGEPVDARTDLFAFGVILYELSTGTRPFIGATAADISSSILRDTSEPIAKRRPDLPLALGHIIEQCLHKGAAARYAGARELVDALRALQSAPQERPAPEDGGIHSVAVLPLDNMSRDPAQEYFADGMTEALISDLARLRNLRVISRTSIMKYKGVQKSMPEIGRELNVDAILEGSALLVGKRVRINVQLVHARQDRMLWSDRYDRNLEDVLDLQSDVAQAVAKEIELRVSPAEAKRLTRRQVNPEAHLEFLRGQHIAAGTSPQAIELSLRHFQHAIELDPDFAPAWAGISDCHHTRAARGMAPPAQAIAQSRAAAERALQLDDSLADAYAVLGAIESRELNRPEAIRHLQKAIELNPSLALARYTLGRIYYCVERHAEAQKEMLHALSLDPLSMIIHTTVGDAYYFAREYEKSVAYYRKAITLDPRFDGAHTDLARSLEALGQFDEAGREYEEGRRLSGGVAGPSFGLAHLAASRGDIAEARRMLAELTAARASRVISAWGIAALHASLGDADEAFRWLEEAVKEGATGLVLLRAHPRLDPIRKDPRFPALVHRLGLDRV